MLSRRGVTLRWGTVAALVVLTLGAYAVVVSEEQLVSPRAARDALRRVGGPPPAIRCFPSGTGNLLPDADDTPALVDPRRSLMGNEVLLCEVPDTRNPDSRPRLFTMLGTPVVPGADFVIPPPGQIPTTEVPAHSPSGAFPSFDEWKVQQLEDRERRKRRRNTTDPASSSSPAPVVSSSPHVQATPVPTEAPVIPESVPSAPLLAVDDAPAALAELKHRWNYASLDCAAAVHKANPSAKFPSAILSDKKDKYMLSPCPAAICAESRCTEAQFVVVELCQHIRIDTLVLGNLEFFSSMFKRFEVRVASSLNAPEENWHLLGSFRARNVRGLQVFRLEHIPSAYFRYMRIDFTEHYGSEHYCPVSVLRVYGRNEREDADEEMAQEEEEDTDTDTVPVLESVQQPPALELPQQSEPGAHESDHEDASSMCQAPHKYTLAKLPPRHLRKAPGLVHVNCDIFSCHSLCALEPFPGVMPRMSRRVSGAALVDAASTTPNASTCTDVPHNVRLQVVVGNASTDGTIPPLDKGLLDELHTQGEMAGGGPCTSCTTKNESGSNGNPPSAFATGTSGELHGTANGTTRAAKSGSRMSRSNNSTLGGTESIYRTITKRLTALESNTSLSMQYLQLSSQVLRDKLTYLEHLQEKKLAQLVVSNAQQLTELHKRQSEEMRYTRVAFETQNQRMETERAALLLKIERMTHDMRLEKRWSVMQLVLLLCLLAFMAMTRNALPPTAVADVQPRHDEWGQASRNDLSRSTTPVPQRNQMPGGVPGWADPWADTVAENMDPHAQRDSPAASGRTNEVFDPDESVSTVIVRDDRSRRPSFQRPVTSWRRRHFTTIPPTAARYFTPGSTRSEARVRGIPPQERAPRPLNTLDSRSDTESVDSTV